MIRTLLSIQIELRIFGILSLLLLGGFSTISSQDWQPVGSISDNNTVIDIDFADLFKGTILDDQSNVWSTLNGAGSWDINNPPGNVVLNNIEITDQDQVWAMGENGGLFTGSIASGPIGWIQINTPTNNQLNNAHFNRPKGGWVVGDNNTILYFDTTSFNPVLQPIPGFDGNCNDVIVVGQLGIIASSTNRVVISQNGGKSWNIGATLPFNNNIKIEYLNNSFYMFSQLGGVAISSDGIVWNVLNTPGGGHRDFTTDSGILHLVGDAGSSYKSTSGGISWAELNGVPDSVNLGAVASLPNGCFTGGTFGKVYFHCAAITLGGKVWGDRSGDCIAQNVEQGYANVEVRAIDIATNTSRAAITDDQGRYEILVPPGKYNVIIPAFNFNDNSPLHLTYPCDTVLDPNLNIPNDQNGVLINGEVRTSVPIELTCGDELGPQGVINTTVDFGLTFACASAQSNNAAAVTCENPIFSCDLSLISDTCHIMESLVTNTPSRCKSPTMTSNMSWFTFYGGYGNYDIVVELQGCFPGDNGEVGATIGVIGSCNDTLDITCFSLCGGNKTYTIDGALLTPGVLYNLYIDGCEGSVCGYTINIEGTYEEYLLPDPTSISCNGGNCVDVCPGSEITFEIHDANDSYTSIDVQYIWEISSGVTLLAQGTVDSNKINYTFNTLGTYDVCWKEISNNCESKVIDFCTTINVIQYDDEDFGNIELCPSELFSYPGPTSVDGEGIITDPNMDGLTGWYDNPGTFFFNFGQNTQLVVLPNGCEFQQTVNLIDLNGDNIEEVELVLCESTEFPVTILGQTFNGPVNDVLVTIPGGSVNGCDTSNNVTIHYMDFEGSIIQDGCDSSGIRLVFEATLAANSGNFPLNISWVNSNNVAVPDDGDGDPFTTLVPYGNDTYTLTISANIAGIRTCSYSFTSFVNLGVPNIISPDSLCVGDEGLFQFNLPTGIDPVNALWNVDNGIFAGQFQVNQPMNIYWDTAGTKNITFAYLQNGCYVETMAEVEVISKFTNNEVMCSSGIDFVGFSWIDVPFSNVVGIEVITGQTGTQNGNSFTVTNLAGGENVIINLQIESSVCTPYNVIAACASIGCDTIAGLPKFEECGETETFPLCDISTLGSGCATFNMQTIGLPQLDCAVGDVFSENWIPFTAGTGDYEIVVSISNCEIGDGVQYALLKGCDELDPVICSTNCTEDNITISSNALIPGQKYTIWMNGCNGNLCDYSIQTNGNFESFDLTSPTDVQINGNAVDTLHGCSGDPVTFEALFSPGTVLFAGATFNWEITEESTGNITAQSTSSPILSLSPDLGLYQICLNEVLHDCSSIAFTPICKVLDIKQSYDDLDISCQTTTSEIIFSWDSIPGHINYDVVVTTGQSGILDGTTFTVTGLDLGEEVSITVTTTLSNGCEDFLINSASCIANDCIDVNIIIDFGGPLIICLNDNSQNIDLTPVLVPMINGVGVFSGPGIIDANEGIVDPNLAGIGEHLIVYDFVADDGCIYSGSIQLIIIQGINASFALSSDQICTEDSITVTFDGDVNADYQFVWEFGGSSSVTGTDLGPYVVSYDVPGEYVIGLTLIDSLCGQEIYLDTLIVDDCSSCICPDIIDTSIICSSVFEPVCGCDGITYNNACEAQFYFGVQSWMVGPCNNTELDTVRAICDDGDPLTIDDVINENCECKGKIIDEVIDFNRKYSIHPNPTNGLLIIEGFDNGNVKVIDVYGRIILDIQSSDNQLDLSELEAGWYFILLHDGYGKILKI